jgi:hypothetical protein
VLNGPDAGLISVLYTAICLVHFKAEVAKQSIVIYQSIAASCFVDRGRFLVSIKIYLSPHYDKQIFV